MRFAIFAALLCGAAGASWTYDAQDHWPGVCSTGSKQSPIDIRTADADRVNMTELRFHHYDSTGGFNVTGAGKMVRAHGFDTWKQRPYIDGGGLDGNYTLDEVHFHWHRTGEHPGSEHSINGVHYPIEIQMVHRGQLKGQEHIAVVAVFATFKAPSDDDRTVVFGGRWFSPEELLPANRARFYRYEGSLTTPSCDEIVTWTVMEAPLSIPSKLADVLHSFNATTGSGVVHNRRSQRPLNDRRVILRDTHLRAQRSYELFDADIERNMRIFNEDAELYDELAQQILQGDSSSNPEPIPTKPEDGFWSGFTAWIAAGVVLVSLIVAVTCIALCQFKHTKCEKEVSVKYELSDGVTIERGNASWFTKGTHTGLKSKTRCNAVLVSIRGFEDYVAGSNGGSNQSATGGADADFSTTCSEQCVATLSACCYGTIRRLMASMSPPKETPERGDADKDLQEQLERAESDRDDACRAREAAERLAAAQRLRADAAERNVEETQAKLAETEKILDEKRRRDQELTRSLSELRDLIDTLRAFSENSHKKAVELEARRVGDANKGGFWLGCGILLIAGFVAFLLGFVCGCGVGLRHTQKKSEGVQAKYTRAANQECVNDTETDTPPPSTRTEL